ncbi:MAG: energy transducer TonB, partial [Alphaproteobacteria bacterium]|nr:energy transducer TonB [Alphaproteobacteria bacterium]
MRVWPYLGSVIFHGVVLGGGIFLSLQETPILTQFEIVFSTQSKGIEETTVLKNSTGVPKKNRQKNTLLSKGPEPTRDAFYETGKQIIEEAITPPQFFLGNPKTPKPAYPRLARKKGWQGKVVLEVIVCPRGKTKSVKVACGSGHRILDEAAIET